jgi:hypothetical protein
VIFGEIPSAEAEGVRLAHTLKLPQLTLKKAGRTDATKSPERCALSGSL